MLDGLWSLSSFIVAVALLVSFHEFGHFWVARKLGVKVLRFSVGFGRPLWVRRGRDGVEYVVSAIPLGGYVKMLDEREGIVAPADLPRAFNRQPVGRRALIVAAGPAFNFMLAIAAFWAVQVGGTQGLRPILAAPVAATRAANAGLKAGDEVAAVNGKAVATWQELHAEIIDQALAGDGLELRLQTGARVSIPLQGVRLDPEFLFDDLGLKPYEPVIPAQLAEVVEGESAARAGLQAGDRLLARDGIAIASWQDWATWLRAHPGAVVQLDLERAGERLRREVLIGKDAASAIGRFGARVEVPEGLFERLRVEVRREPLEALGVAAAQTWQMSLLTLKMFGRMITGEVSLKNVSGPIQIAEYAGVSAQLGLAAFLGFIAVISISLGVLNLLPIPVLDGGHLLYYAVEALKGSPLTERAQTLGQQVGMALLFALMGLAFYNDIYRLIG